MNTSHRRTVLVILLGLVLVIISATSSAIAQEDAGREPGRSKSPQALLPGVNDFIAMQSNLSVQEIEGGLTAEDLAQNLVGSGVSISNVSYSGANIAAGTFTGGDEIIGFDSGILLTSGSVHNVVGPNVEDSISMDNAQPGDADLSAISGFETFDASVLEFDFVPNTSTVSFQYVFASDEYNEFVDTAFNDVFAFFINGNNCAKVESIPVTINSINRWTHPGLFINNDFQGGASINTEMDGLTTVLTCYAEVNQGTTNTMKLAIADASDGVYDSAVFLQRSSFVAPDCSEADKDVQPILLVHGWGSNDDLSQDTQGFAQWVNDNGTLESAGKKWVEGCNLRFATDIRDDYGESHVQTNLQKISSNLKRFRQQVVGFDPKWNGHFDIIGHSYGGLNARFYLESSQYLEDLGSGIRVDNLITLGSPHGGVDILSEMYPAALVIGWEHKEEDERPGLYKLFQMDDHNEQFSQPDNVCYWLIGGDFLTQPDVFWKVPAIYATYSLYESPSDIGVSVRSSLALATDQDIIDRYPNSVSILTDDMHGYKEYVDEDIPYYLGDLKSYVRPKITFDEEILGIVSQPMLNPSDNMARCRDAIEASNELPTEALHTSSDVDSVQTVLQPIQIASSELTPNQSESFDAVIDGFGPGVFYYSSYGGRLEFSLEDPSGSLFTRQSAESDPSVEYVEISLGDTTVGFFAFDDLSSGKWVFKLANDSLNTISFNGFWLRDFDLTLSLNTPMKVNSGESAAIEGTLTNGSSSVSGAIVSAEAQFSDGSTQSLQLLDDGVFPDSIADDGVYTTILTPTEPGNVTIVAEASGTLDSEEFYRTAFGGLVVLPDTISLESVVSDYGEDENDNDLYDLLAVEVSIASTEFRDVTISGVLKDQTSQIVDTMNVSATVEPGSNVMRLEFMGKKIFENGLDGPYTLSDVSLFDNDIAAIVDSIENPYQTQDYSYQEFEGSLPPFQPSLPYPSDGAAGVSQTTSLNWTGEDPNDDPVTYEVYFGTDNTPPLVAGSQTEPIYIPDELLPGKVYYWQIVAIDVDGNRAEGPLWTFKTVGTDAIYLSTSSKTSPDGERFEDEDILTYNDNSSEWSLYLDGSAVGLKKADINAFHILEDGDILMSFDRPIKNLPGMRGILVDDSDIVRFKPIRTALPTITSGQFELYFDGSDVNLRSGGEDIDAISILDDGRIILSTLGSAKIEQLLAKDEDLLAFTPTQLGEDTVGTFELYLDGSDIHAKLNDIAAVHIESNGDILMAALKKFKYDNMDVNPYDILSCAPQSLGEETACTVVDIYWAGSDFGLGGRRDKIDGFSLGAN